MEIGDPGSPSPGHWAPPWGQGRAEAGPGHVPAGGPGSAGPMAGHVKAMET